jgi:hypothetical protein
VPSVYYGDEQGFRGLKEDRAGGDDAIRPAFPASPAGLSPDGWRYYRLHQRLIGFRRRHPWLVRARTAHEHLEPSALALRLRGEGDGEQALLLLNTGDAEFRFPVDAGGLSGRGDGRTGRGQVRPAARPAALLDHPGVTPHPRHVDVPLASLQQRPAGRDRENPRESVLPVSVSPSFSSCWLTRVPLTYVP